MALGAIEIKKGIQRENRGKDGKQRRGFTTKHLKRHLREILFEVVDGKEEDKVSSLNGTNLPSKDIAS